MKSESNRNAIKILITLVLVVAMVFSAEKKFLVLELRGETISNYEKIKWHDKIILLVEDFEGLKSDSLSLTSEGFFSYGSIKTSLDNSLVDNNIITSKTTFKAEWNGKENYGGWGKGVGKDIELNPLTDYLNFRLYVPPGNGTNQIIKIIFEEEDNHDGILQQDKDDGWYYVLNVSGNEKWQFISIPIKDFKDNNAGGDGILNVTKKGGLHTIIFSFEQTEKHISNHKWYFDFICFTNKKITESEIE